MPHSFPRRSRPSWGFSRRTLFLTVLSGDSQARRALHPTGVGSARRFDSLAFEENNDGIIVTKTARVAKREYEGSERVFKTAQQAELFRWAPGHKSPRITLLDRPIENDAKTLFGSEVWVFDDA